MPKVEFLCPFSLKFAARLGLGLRPEPRRWLESFPLIPNVLNIFQEVGLKWFKMKAIDIFEKMNVDFLIMSNDHGLEVF